MRFFFRSLLGLGRALHQCSDYRGVRQQIIKSAIRGAGDLPAN
jgi:hypothetical protein